MLWKSKKSGTNPIGWIGLHLKKDGTNTLYSDNTNDAVQLEFNWTSGEPNDNQECVYFTNDGTLSDGFCDQLKFTSICQIKGKY